MIPDEKIEHLAGEFQRSGLRAELTFEQFIELPEWKRNRMLLRATQLNQLRATHFAPYQEPKAS